MKPLKGDIVVNGKRGLDGFPGTDLESHLVKKKIEARRLRPTLSTRLVTHRPNPTQTVVLSGFLTNCCVESTMRTAYEKGT